MIRTLDRYLLKMFLVNYALATAVLISLYVVLDLFANIDEFTESGYELTKVLRNIADYYFYNLPLYFSQIAGVLVLLSACMTLARLQRQNEITAILASGTSLYRIVTPIILAALGLNFLLFLDHEFMLPHVATKLARQRDDVEGVRPYEIWFVRDGENRLVSARQFSPKEQKVRGLIIMELSTDPDTRGRMQDLITADKAEWDAERRGWNLTHRGARISVTGDMGNRLTGEESIVRTPVKFYPCELSPEELRFRKMAQWTQFLSIRQLNDLLVRGEVEPDAVAQIKHNRFAMTINNMILLVLGITFFMNRLPANVLTQAAKALVVCACAVLIIFIGQRLVGASGVFDPALPAWMPIFLFGPVAVVLLEKVKT